MKTTTSAFAAVCLTIPFFMSTADAGPPAETCRMFGVLDLAEEGCIGWESDASRRIVSHQDGSSDVIEFITVPSAPSPWRPEDAIVDLGDGKFLDLADSVWTRMPLVHVTTSGAEEVSHVYWLEEDMDNDGIVDPPGPGMTAATGPGGDVIDFVEIRIARASSSDSWNPNRFYITPTGSTRLCIAVGLFQR